MHVASGLGLCLSLLLSVACEKTQSELFTPQLAVHCLLLDGDEWRSAFVNRTYAIDEQFDTVFAGADVRLSGSRGEWGFEYAGRDGYNTAVPVAALPGDTFRLRVARDGFDTVYGHTVVPDTFAILFPRDGDTVSIADSMVWTRSRNCAGYYMSFKTIQGRDTFFFDLAISNDTTAGNYDSLVFRLQQMFFLYQFEPGIHTLQLYALDTNYFDWVSAGGFGFGGGGGGDTTHLVGGLGVFGSAAAESMKVYVRTDTTGPRGAGRIQNSDIRMQKSEVADTDGGTRCAAYGVRFAGQDGLSALWSGSGVVSARSPYLAMGQPLRDRGQQLLTLDRLGDERIGPGFERGLDIFLGHTSGENEDRRAARLVPFEHRAD
jgi:hypothetical protein